MFSTLRFLFNKPLFLVPVVLLIVAVLTTHKPPKAKHINPWATASAASGDAADQTADAAADSSDSAAGSAASSR